MFSIRRSDIILIFLMLVIVVTVVKVAVPLPLSEKAKEAQRLTTCQANLKNCTKAFLLYVNDYDATLPSSYVAVRPPRTPTQAEIITFLTGKNPWPMSDDAYNTSPGPFSWAQMFSPYIPRKNIVFCPSDKSGTRVSYWWKYAIDRAWREGQPPMRREGDFGDPAHQIVLYEHASWHFGNAAGIKDGVKINVGYMDGHVNMVTVKNGPAVYPSSENERTGASAIRLGEPMYFNYDIINNQGVAGEASYIDPSRYADVFE